MMIRESLCGCLPLRLESVHGVPDPHQGIVVAIVPLALVLEARVVYLPDCLLDHWEDLILADVYPVAIVRPVDNLYLMVRPKTLQWERNPGLHLEAVLVMQVLDDADEAVRGEDPHQDHLPGSSVVMGEGADAPPPFLVLST